MALIYLYGVIPTQAPQNFGLIGLNNMAVTTITGSGMAAVVSELPKGTAKVAQSRDNMMTHQRVLEKALETFTVLPVTFGTIVENEAEVRDFLAQNQEKFKGIFARIDGKVELSLKCMWNDMKQVFAQISEHPEIAALKAQIQAVQLQGGNAQPLLIEVGQRVEHLLQQKKEEEAQQIAQRLAHLALDHKVNKNISENMFANLVFLVDRAKEKAFDQAVNAMGQQMQSTARLKYVGPLAPHHFLN